MSSRHRRKGFQHERELVRKLWKLGFAVIRAPASGSKVKRSVYPDVTAIYKGNILVFEVKVRNKPQTVYVERRQVEKLMEFSRRASAKAFIAIKFIGHSDWRFIPIDKLEETSGGNFKITPDAFNGGLTLSDLLKLVGHGGLTRFVR